MSIEVKELNVKASVNEDIQDPLEKDRQERAKHLLKQEILEEVMDKVEEMLERHGIR